jgi:hypothetical protein
VSLNSAGSNHNDIRGIVMATKTLPQRQTEALDRAISSASSLEQAIACLKAAGYEQDGVVLERYQQ